MIGVEFVEDRIKKTPDKNLVNKILLKSRENGLLLVSCGKDGNVIRFMGPLTTPLEQVNEALNIFENSLI
jgi:4-aminobutyrate aminotransferase/(S)-3-amino-2-methylpropionate transaminase